MRLLNSENLEFVNFDGTEPKTYAILSHTWYNDHEEVSYQDMCNSVGTQKLGFEKLRKCGEIAKSQGYQYFWIDTCCIDKSSSAELSEAINSMYLWYKTASVCYVFLSDVSASSFATSQSSFKRSKWFTRGWTLQELIVPLEVEFLSKEWELLGTKSDLKVVINEVTGIPIVVLQGAPSEQFSVAERMSWASTRKTKRVEDRAYSLMGLFDVHMPLLYGEKEKAFFRLQEEIMKTSDDQSIFAWKDSKLQPEQYVGLLARTPDYFVDSKNIYSMGFWHNGAAFAMTNKGSRLRLFLILLLEAEGIYRASLDCWVKNSRNHSIAIYLKRLSGAKDHWAPNHETQFARVQGGRFDTIVAEQKARGRYREIFIRQNPIIPMEQLPGSKFRSMKYFRINHQKPYLLVGTVEDLIVFPPECWDPQTRIFASVANTGKIGGFLLDGKDHGLLTIFGISTVGTPWIKITNSQSPEQAWNSYQQTGSEVSECKVKSAVDNFITLNVKIALTNMYGSSLFEIDAIFEHEKLLPRSM